MERRGAAGGVHTSLVSAAMTLACASFALGSPPLHVAAAEICPPPPDLPSAPWPAALLFAGVAGAALVLATRGRGRGGTNGGRRLGRGSGGGLAAVILVTAISGAAGSLSGSTPSAPKSANADTCPPSVTPTPSPAPQGPSATPAPSAPGNTGSGVSGSSIVPVPATGARTVTRDDRGR